MGRLCESVGRGGQALGGGRGERGAEREGCSGWSTGWLPVASARVGRRTGGWIERPGGTVAGRRVNQREEVARLFVCQPRWDPLPILSHSTLPRPPHPPGPALSSRSTTLAERSAQGRLSADVFAKFLSLSLSLSLCVRTRARGRARVGG